MEKQLTKSDIWERKLLDFSLRNTMLNLIPRRKAIQFISFDVDLVEDYLQDGKEFCILSRPECVPVQEASERLFSSEICSEYREQMIKEVGPQTLNTFLPEGETGSVLKSIYRAARTAIEETGANSLYLAIGALRWFEEGNTEQPRYAPILLLPVTMVYKRGKYFIRTCEEEIVLNITLVEFLRQNYGLEVEGLATLPQDEHGVDVKKIFEAFTLAIEPQKQWKVVPESVLGIFSFSKFLMWNDIHANKEHLMSHPVVQSLVQNGLTFVPKELQMQLRDFDHVAQPNEMALPVAVDSSQMAAVCEAGRGSSFILYGPPGTGKSQTITNLIANALYQGKRVLFVAEKMAALEVVQRRLEKVGLGPFCLELHSNKVAKRHVLGQLNEALNEVRHIQKPKDYEETASRLFEQRQKLLDYMDALHRVGDDGWSLYDCIARYESSVGEAMEIPSLKPLRGLTEESMRDYDYKLSSPLETVLGLVGQPCQHPLHDLLINKDTLARQEELKTTLQEALKQLDAFEEDQTVDNSNTLVATLRKAATLVAGGMEKLIHATSAEVLEEYAIAKADLLTSRDNILKTCDEDILKCDPSQMAREWGAIQLKWFLPRWFAARSYVKQLKLYNTGITQDQVPQLLETLKNHRKKSDRVGAVEPKVENSLQKVVNISTLREKLERWYQNLRHLRDWYQWCDYRVSLLDMGMDVVVNQLQTQVWKSDELRQNFVKGFYRAKCSEKMAGIPMLDTFEGVLFDEQVKRYKELTATFQSLCQKELYARLAANVPRVTDGISASSEIGFLNRNISNGGRGVSIRDLMDRIPQLLPRLCPCMLMSPMSVAQYISHQQEPFDLVIFDEASQMPTSEAVGAIARGKSLIVVGDPKQMPPTSFFVTSNVEEEEAEIDDLESILEDCRTLGLPSLQLSWHYRSRHESLIAFSNSEYYDGSLITFPSVDDQQTCVRFVPVEGNYDRAGKRSNQAEADAIVEEIVRRLRDPKLHAHSIGVVAFSVVQQNLVEDVLSERLDSDHELQELADSMYEPIFVKNLENVQGDERDVILFSIGYGPDKDGKVLMNFGPLNNNGGERRLNVAVSRARHEMIVFSTLHASQIDLNRTKAKGVEGLKHFLEYAEFQQLAENTNLVEQPDDVTLAQQIAQELQKRGCEVQCGVGRSQFKVDVAVVNPDNPARYSLGILIDGEAYRDTQTTRDREIVQPGVLQSLCWRLMRVWSIDWLNNPQRVLDRIEKLLQEPDPDSPGPKTEQPAPFDISKEKMIEAPTSAVKYRKYSGKCSADNYTTSIRNILKVEQPMTRELLCRRLAEGLALSRVTPSLQQQVDLNIRHYFYDQQIDDQHILWLDLASAEAFQGYRTDSDRDISEVPIVEVDNCLSEVVAQQLSLDEDSATLIVAKRLGYARRGPKLDAALHKSVDFLVRHGKLQRQDGRLSIVG